MKQISKVKNTLTAHLDKVNLGETIHICNRTDIIGYSTKTLESTEDTQEFQGCSNKGLIS